MLEANGYAGGVSGPANLKAEFSDAQHLRGTLSMARSADPNSAGSQFFLCVARAASLDNQYTVFGQAVMGMDVADVIVHAELDPAAGRDHPKEPVLIKNITIIEGTDGLNADEKKAWNDMPTNLKTRK